MSLRSSPNAWDRARVSDCYCHKSVMPFILSSPDLHSASCRHRHILHVGIGARARRNRARSVEFVNDHLVLVVLVRPVVIAGPSRVAARHCGEWALMKVRAAELRTVVGREVDEAKRGRKVEWATMEMMGLAAGKVATPWICGHLPRSSRLP